MQITKATLVPVANKKDKNDEDKRMIRYDKHQKESRSEREHTDETTFQISDVDVHQFVRLKQRTEGDIFAFGSAERRDTLGGPGL